MNVNQADEVGERSGPTAGVMTAERRSDLKGACRNASVLSVVMLDDILNLRIARSILATASVLKRWHTEQVKTARGCEGCFKWMSDQLVNGHLFKSLMEMWDALQNPVQLQKAGFTTTLQAAKLAAQHGQHIIDDEVAEYYGSFNVYTIEARLRRMIYLWGAPHILLMVHSKQANIVAHWCHLFRKDVTGFRQLQALDQKSAMMEQVLRIFLDFSYRFCLQ